MLKKETDPNMRQTPQGMVCTAAQNSGPGLPGVSEQATYGYALNLSLCILHQDCQAVFLAAASNTINQLPMSLKLVTYTWGPGYWNARARLQKIAGSSGSPALVPLP